MAQIDLNNLINSPDFSLVLASRQREHPRDACIRRFKEIILFLITIGIILCAFAGCAYIIFGDKFSNDDKKWATAIASSIISAFLGFLTGKGLSQN